MTEMARPDTPLPDLDACKDIVVTWYKSVFGFTDLVATALYDEQLLRNKNTLAKLSDNEVNNVMHAIRRTQAIAKLSSARLKLAIFWIKHQDRTQREIGIPARPLVTIKLIMMLLLKPRSNSRTNGTLAIGGPAQRSCPLFFLFWREPLFFRHLKSHKNSTDQKQIATIFLTSLN